ncbi:hypothetical protein [Nostoc sp.]
MVTNTDNDPEPIRGDDFFLPNARLSTAHVSLAIMSRIVAFEHLG